MSGTRPSFDAFPAPMSNSAEQARTWEDRDADPERAVADLREGIQRARDQLRHLRDAIEREPPAEA
jgi:hypothetical protein